MTLRNQLVAIAREWQKKYGVAPAITSSISEYDAAMLVGMTEDDYMKSMAKMTAVNKGHDFKHNGTKYQIKARRSSGRPGSKITNAGKASNYEWHVLIWIRYDKEFVMQEALSWQVDEYKKEFDHKKRISLEDIRQGLQLYQKEAKQK